MALTDKDVSNIFRYTSYPGIEIEIRFGRYKYEEKKYYLSRAEFLRVENFFGYDSVKKYTIVSRSWKGGIREDTINNKEKKYIKKQQLEFIPFTDLSLDISIAS